MKPLLVSALVATFSLPLDGSALGDESARRVRASASVEVIDDSRHVDDIIKRMKAARQIEPTTATNAQGSTAATQAEKTPAEASRRIERPALPNAVSDGNHNRAADHAERNAQLRHDRRTERETHTQTAPTARHRR